MKIRQFLQVGLLLTIASPHFVLSQDDCHLAQNKGCRSDRVEVYKDFDDDDGSGEFSVMCCDEYSDGETKEKLRAVACQLTPCVDSASAKGETDLCPDNAVNRWVNGSRIQYEEVAREVCTSEDTPKGMEALCCPKNSKSGMLTLLLGAENHQFPHFARLSIVTQNGRAGCGGSIYNEWYIITASHCVLKGGVMRSPKGSFVELDVHLSSNDNPNKYEAVEFIAHPNSTLWNKKPGNAVNDVALIKLSRKIEFGPNIKALPIAKPDFDPFKYSDNAVIIGVGTTDTTLASPILQRANVVLRDDARNIERGPWSGLSMKKDASGVLFLGGVQDGIKSPHSGQGDSGGPAICRDENGLAVLCGVDSGGKGHFEECEEYFTEEYCAPDKYMEVAHFHDWFVSKAGDQRNAEVAKIPLYGSKVPDDKYEHQVRITSSRHSCGGTLIEKDVVLTAAHCVVDDKGNRKSGLKVTAQLRDLNSKSGKDFEVISHSILDGFKRGQKGSRRRRIAMFKMDPTPKEAYYTNDLALVKLREKVAISSKKLAKIGQATFSDENGDPNWHTEVAFPLNSTRSGALEEREFKLLHRRSCQRRLNRASFAGFKITLGEDIMCGEEKYNGGAQCDRELGGGLICGSDSDGMDVLCGVQTFRFCQLALPSAFLDVGKFKSWITDAKSRL